jgi:hypothetical protein
MLKVTSRIDDGLPDHPQRYPEQGPRRVTASAGEVGIMQSPSGPAQAAMRKALQHAASALTSAGIPWALTGGYALFAFGAPEPSHDVDIIVAPDEAEAAARCLADAGFDIERPPENWLVKAWWRGADEPAMVDLIHELAGVPVDNHLLGAVEQQQLIAVDMPVLQPQHVLAAKLKVLDERNCDYAALLPAARAVREQIDWEALREQFAEQPFALGFLELLDRLGIVGAGAVTQTSATA